MKAGGGIISTDEDMVHLGHELNSGRLLKAQTLRELYRTQLAADIQYPPAARQRAEVAMRPVPKPPRQALIVRINDDGRGGVYSQHGGSVKGSLSQYSKFSRDGIVVALHANAWVDIDLQEAAETLAKLALGDAGAANEKPK